MGWFKGTLVGATGIEIATPHNKSCVVKGVALLPLFQLVSNGVRLEIQLLYLLVYAPRVLGGQLQAKNL